MKKHYLLILIALLSFISNAQIVNIPDANFKAELLNHVPTIDTNSDNEIQTSEALAITMLFVINGNISDLTGVEAFTNLTTIYVENNQLTQLDISALSQLNKLYCTNNQITSIDFSANAVLDLVDCTSNPITELDFSQNPMMLELICFNPLLESLNIKNGAESAIYITQGEAPNLRFICCDTEDIAYYENFLEIFELPLVNVSSYCTFSPGGKYNTITGTCRHDLANDGCAVSDPILSNLRLNLSDGLGSEGSVFTDQFGKYKFFTAIGNFTVVPVPVNDYFTFSPVSPTISFVNDNQNITVQDFCLVANGVHQDLEITLASTIPARPGFEATYVIIYKNNGTESMSGTVNLQFNDSLMDFVLASPPATTQALGSIDWTFTNLAPFESRTINVTVNINAPTDTPSVNIDDQLDFVATVFPIIGDETPVDNVFELHQVAVGSFDPNDITCQEGATIGVEQVGEYLHYLIRFQNSGNFYAENVVVKNIINEANFDLATLELIGTSHPQVTSLTDNKLEFIFEGINLPAEADDEPGSHGYIAYKVKTTNGLGIGDSVSQSADIFFDFNFPIITNNAVTTVTALGVKQFNDNAVAVYPNPAKNLVTVSADGLKKVSVYDLQGRLLESQPAQSDKYTLDISNRSRGLYLLRVETATGVKIERLVKD